MKYFSFSVALVLSMVCLSQSVEAQIWKKIKNKTQQKVEDKIADKVSDKLAEVVLEKLSKSFNSPSNPYKDAVKISKPSNLPGEYAFDWKYQLKMTSPSNSSDIVFDYRLPTEGNYYGYSLPESEEMFSVVDSDKEVIISYTEEEGNLFALSHSYPSNMVESNMYSLGAAEEMEITNLPDKEFIGYIGKGYKIETLESEMIIYITSEAGVNFSGMGGLPNQAQTKSFAESLDETKNTLMLYMKFTSKTNSDNVMEMECIGLEKESFNKNNSDYKFL